MLVLAAVAQAGTGGLRYDVDKMTSTTFTNAASTVTNIAVVLDVRRQPSVTIQLDLMPDGTGANTNLIAYSRSTDGVTYESVLSSISTTNPVTAGVKYTWVGKLDPAGCGYIKLNYFTNYNAINLTNGTTLHAPINFNAP